MHVDISNTNSEDKLEVQQQSNLPVRCQCTALTTNITCSTQLFLYVPNFHLCLYNCISTRKMSTS